MATPHPDPAGASPAVAPPPMPLSSAPTVVVALDFSDAAPALALAQRLDPSLCGVKVGKELFTSAGPDVVRALVARGFRVFLDLKFHDIPNTVAQACAAATRLGVWMINVHAAGGRDMMRAALDAVERTAAVQGAAQRPLLIAVTVLTSMNDDALAETGVRDSARGHALHLAMLARASGLDGVVCSAVEAPALRAALGRDFVLVTPGIRPAGSAADDQSRIMTPALARAAGADVLVIGRPITRADDPVAALAAIHRSLTP